MPSIGLKLTLPDPENPASVIRCQFATARSFPELKEKLRAIADADIAENVAIRRLSIVSAQLDSAPDEAAAEALQGTVADRRHALDDATIALLDATRDFIVSGFALAGASAERAEELADAVGIEHLQELKAKCLFGAGCLDFTKTAGQI